MNEMRLVFESGMRSFPPRLEGQPIFYPVLNESYADQIAREWNTKESTCAGYVLRFEIPDDYGERFEPHVVGEAIHEELWVPAEQLDELNERIMGPILGVRAFFGQRFRGHVPARFGLKGMDACTQAHALIGSMRSSPSDFGMEVGANAVSIYLNHPFWVAAGAERLGVAPEDLGALLRSTRGIWSAFPRAAPLVEDAVLTGVPA